MTVPLTGTLSRKNSANFPIAVANDVANGFKSVADHATRDGLPSSTLTLGTWIKTLNDGLLWEVTGVGPVVFSQVTFAVADNTAYLRTDGTRAATGDLDLGSHKLKNVSSGTLSSDAVNLGQLLNAVQGLDAKGHCTCLYAANVASLSGAPATTDGVTPTTGDTVFLNGQNTPSQNGPWVTASGSWTRPANFATGSHAGSAFFFIQKGTVYADTGWLCSTDPANDIVDTNSLAFVQFSAAGQIQPGTGLTKVGNTISIAAGGVTDTEVSAVAAIAGTKISPDFGAQNLTTTGHYTSNSTSGYVAVGIAPGTGGGSGVGVAANSGALRLPANNGAILVQRNNTDSGDLAVYSFNTAAAQGTFGNSSTPFVLQGSSLQLAVGSTNRIGLSSTQATVSLNLISFNNAGLTLAPVINQINSSGAAVDLSVRAQGTTAGSTNGARLRLQGGMPGSGGLKRGPALQLNVDDSAANMQNMLEATEVATGQRILSLCRTADLTVTQMPSNTGDLVIYVGDRAAAPTIDAATGHIYYSDSGRPAWRFSGHNRRFDGTAGAATAGAATLPANPLGFFQETLDGTTVKVPYYAA